MCVHKDCRTEAEEVWSVWSDGCMDVDTGLTGQSASSNWPSWDDEPVRVGMHM